MNPTRPVMRYHGGKWRLAPWIISHFPRHELYVEPFGGAASVLLRKIPSQQEVYNDLDSEIVNVFRILRDQKRATELTRLMFLTPHSREEFNRAFEPSDNPVEQARRTLIRAGMGHGSNAATRISQSGFRSKRMGFASPAWDTANYPPCIPAFIERLRSVVIENRQAVDVISLYDSPVTLHYIDPPYLPETRTFSEKSYRHEMTPAQHHELADVLHSVQGMVIVSGYDSLLYRELYADWHMTTYTTRAEHAVSRTEVLWLSPKATRHTQQIALMDYCKAK